MLWLCRGSSRIRRHSCNCFSMRAHILSARPIRLNWLFRSTEKTFISARRSIRQRLIVFRAGRPRVRPLQPQAGSAILGWVRIRAGLCADRPAIAVCSASVRPMIVCRLIIQCRWLEALTPPAGSRAMPKPLPVWPMRFWEMIHMLCPKIHG